MGALERELQRQYPGQELRLGLLGGAFGSGLADGLTQQGFGSPQAQQSFAPPPAYLGYDHGTGETKSEHTNREMTFKEELQEDVDSWLSDVGI